MQLAIQLVGIIGGGQVFPALTNKIDLITFSITSNAIDFGDLTVGEEIPLVMVIKLVNICGFQTDPTGR